ncbi:MerR family transcriptional regulator [Streptomyces sp. MSC1_001]|jgi:DNA-binding transcriptional MerR regulator|uniref:MerR family transcriptional regulator n=1 Tax=Streptomyces sp. MSC1_001 TaxID=2909263 RepID=UPI00202EF3A8|nr:MerR family transcriptional regulator [Streptomyces sp. MSC1_001]
MSDTEHALTTGAVARRLGVSPTTLRSWDQRYGIGPAARVGGRHRRWAPGDVAMLEEMCRLTASGVPPAEAARAARTARARPGAGDVAERRAGIPVPYPVLPAPDAPGRNGQGPSGPARGGPAPSDPGPSDLGPSDPGPSDPGPSDPGVSGPAPSAVGPGGTGAPAPRTPARQPGSGNGLPLGDVRLECRGLARAAVRLDGPTLDSLLRDVVADHGLVTAWEEVMAPTLHAVGRKWESSGDRYVEVEHLLSWHVSTALRQVVAATGPVAMPPVLLACVPAEQHTLPLEALAAGLAERGVPSRMFGAAVPAEALDAAVRRTGPAAVVLWSQARSTANHALAQHVAASSFGVKGARTHPLVMLAGPGWAGRTVQPGMLRPGGLREALDGLSRLYAEAPAPAAG